MRNSLIKGISAFIVFLFCFMVSTANVNAAETLQKQNNAQKGGIKLFSTADEKEYTEQELIVKFKSVLSKGQRKQIINSIKGSELSFSETGNYSLVSVVKNTDLSSIAKRLSKHKSVQLVEPNILYKTAYTPKDKHYKKQWHLPKINMPKAWDKSKGSSSIIVAVIDNGMQTNHPDLKGKITKQKNIVRNNSTITSAAHGTHVAGIIAATQNTIGISGVAPKVKIMPVQVFNGQYADAYSIGDGIIYAVNNGARVLNLSFGSYSYSSYVDSAVAYAHSKGAIIIAAAGNDSTSYTSYPAALNHVLAVSSTNKKDSDSYFSNFGNYINYSAPGEDIYSTVNGSSYEYMDGTSMAAPLVSGVAALMLSKNPWLSPDQIEIIMNKSVKDLGKKGWDSLYGYGRIDASKAMSNTPGQLSTITASTKFTATGKNKHNISVSAYGSSKLSIYVKDSKGKLVRSLVSNKPWSWGKISTSWDGKTGSYSYAKSGKYTLVARMTRGSKNIYKTKTVTVKDNVAPTVTSKAANFSHKVTTSIKVPYVLNKDSKVTVKVLDSTGKTVGTIMKSKTIKGGKQSITWNGKNSSNKLVKDGSYKLSFETISLTKVKGKTVKSSITVDTTINGSLNNIATPFKATEKNKQNATFKSKEKLYMTVSVLNSKGSKVKTLVTNKLYDPSSIQHSWNGTDSKNKFVTEGIYVFQYELKDLIGNKKTIKSKTFNLEDHRANFVSGKGTKNITGNTDVAIPYTLIKASSVSINVYKGSTLVKTILKDEDQKAGSYDFSWNGTNSNGEYIGDGVYTYRINASDKYKNNATYSANLNVDRQVIKVEYPKHVQNKSKEYYETDIEVFYKLSDPATVTVEIYDGDDSLVKTISKNVKQEAGIQNFTWDGVSDDGNDYWYYEPLNYVIKAKTEMGRETKVTGSILSNYYEEYPEWIQSHSVDTHNTGIDIVTNLSKDTEMQLTVYDYNHYNSGNLSSYYDQQTYTFKTGQNTLNYLIPDNLFVDNSYIDLMYVLSFKDELGNKYEYAYNDWYYNY
ncbi:S8 family serine peptidase [Bacillus sp. D386]|uniref:S8 family serine peptidase n=1 Tax=Bacillus sp. D386 TaxID=2587155 RepID=UPI001120FABF|nr:S8 family serine peptidase [Bacillus sp. D386]